MAAKDELGKRGEQVAADYLTRIGMIVLDRNWRCRQGEIDLIAREGHTLVVVEVKTRSSRSHGTALESVDIDKLARLRGVAIRWLATRQEHFSGIRVDVIGLERFAGDFAIRHEKGVI